MLYANIIVAVISFIAGIVTALLWSRLTGNHRMQTLENMNRDLCYQINVQTRKNNTLLTHYEELLKTTESLSNTIDEHAREIDRLKSDHESLVYDMLRAPRV
jgi:uncharacterized membrane protein (DUF106 family)